VDRTHNFPVDREAAGHARSRPARPPYRAWSNRDFLRNAAQFMAGQGVDQFLDVGSGHPDGGQRLRAILGASRDM
jgi:S-adenosyl methyltransferase